MSTCFNEPAIDELLGDSLTQDLMQADGVDAAGLKSMLHVVALHRKAVALRNDRMRIRNDLASIDRWLFNETSLSSPNASRIGQSAELYSPGGDEGDAETQRRIGIRYSRNAWFIHGCLASSQPAAPSPHRRSVDATFIRSKAESP